MLHSKRVFGSPALAPALSGCLIALAVPTAALAETMLGSTDMVTAIAPGVHVMTFYVSAQPGEEFPMHSHGGDGIVLVTKGGVTLNFPNGESRELAAGDTFEEKAGEVHGAKVTGDGAAEFIWTIVLPDGAELETPYEG